MSENITRLFELYLQLSDEIADLAGYAANMDIFWDGAANTAYMQNIADDLVWAAALLVRIRDRLRALRDAFGIMSGAEGEVRNMINEYLNVRIREG